MQQSARLRQSHQAPTDRASDIRELRAPNDPDATERSTPFHARAVESARALAELAIERATHRDPQTARNAVEDALLLLDAADDPSAAARIWILLGEALLVLHEARRAQERFEAAFIVLDASKDIADRARALLGTAHALQMLGDPSARTAYEEAGELYEDVADERMVHAIDRELRAIAADIEESPRSFQSSSRIRMR